MNTAGMNIHKTWKRCNLYSSQFDLVVSMFDDYASDDHALNESTDALESFLTQKEPHNDEYRYSILNQYMLSQTLGKADQHGTYCRTMVLCCLHRPGRF
jgi:hypothetical protein